MKKIISLIIVIVLMLTGCSIAVDDQPAVIEITTSTGLSAVDSSYNGSNKTISGQQLAIENTRCINLEKGEKCYVHFYCESCCTDIQETLDCPSARSYHCICPFNDISREYYCIKVQEVQNDKNTSNP